MDTGVTANSPVHFRLKPAVRHAIARLNIPQNALARRIGITSGFMSQLLTGKRCVGPATRQKLLDFLPNFSFDDLFEEARDDA